MVVVFGYLCEVVGAQDAPPTPSGRPLHSVFYPDFLSPPQFAHFLETVGITLAVPSRDGQFFIPLHGAPIPVKQPTFVMHMWPCELMPGIPGYWEYSGYNRSRDVLMDAGLWGRPDLVPNHVVHLYSVPLQRQMHALWVDKKHHDLMLWPDLACRRLSAATYSFRPCSSGWCISLDKMTYK